MLHKGIARIGKPLKDISASIENAYKLEIYSMEKNFAPWRPSPERRP